MNTARPTVMRSIPFWALVVLSLAAVIFGAWFALTQISAMNAALTAGTATGVEVYGGQSLAVLGGIVLGVGLLGILLALAVASLRAFVPAARREVVEAAEPYVNAGPWDGAPTDGPVVSDAVVSDTVVSDAVPAETPVIPSSTARVDQAASGSTPLPR